MKLLLPIKKSTNNKGFAIVVVLLLVVMVPPVLFGLHSYLMSKTRSLSILEAHSVLHQEARNALKEVEISLMKSRWYLPKHQHKYHLNQNFKSKITVYIDEYETKNLEYIYAQKMGLTRILDHIKVYIHLIYKEREMIAYGKFVISPSPLLLEDSVHAINAYNFKNLEEIPSIRKFAYLDIIPKNYLFKKENQDLDLKNSKDREKIGFAFDLQLQKSNIQSFLQKGVQVKAQRSLIENQKTSSKKNIFKLFYSLGSDEFDSEVSDNTINQFLIQKSKNFHFDFDDSKQQKHEILSIIEVKNPFDQNLRVEMIQEHFDQELTKSKNNALLNKIYHHKNNQSPLFQYYLERKVEQLISLPTEQFIDQISGFPSGHLFQIQWKAHCGDFPSNGDLKDFSRYSKDYKAKKSLFSAENCQGLSSFEISNKKHQQFYHPLKLSDNRDHSILLKHILEYYHKQVSNTPALLVDEKIQIEESIIGGMAQFIH
ncbi:hypothetical protein MJH12_18080 [bacterium]|nr:hypothetical protein [bacterium]